MNTHGEWIGDLRSYSSMDANMRKDEYRKDPETEIFLDDLNESLKDLEGRLKSKRTGSGTASFPSVIMIGAPRCGSTFFTQCVASRLDLAYPSNLMARFYGAPLTGAMLQKIFVRNEMLAHRDFHSEHGVTSGIEEPHEFGYFWARYHNTGTDVHQPISGGNSGTDEIRALGETLEDISKIFEKPVLYKNSLGCFFMSVWERLENTLLVHLRRDPVENIASILRARERRLGDAEKWWSLRPANYHELRGLDPIGQVAEQYREIESSIDEGWDRIPFLRKIRLSFEDLLENPEETVQTLKKAIEGAFPVSVETVGTELRRFEKPVSGLEDSTRDAIRAKWQST